MLDIRCRILWRCLGELLLPAIAIRFDGQNLSPQPVDAMGDLLDHQEAPHTWSWTGHFAQFLPMQAVSFRK